MAAVTPSVVTTQLPGRGTYLHKVYGTSAANTDGTLTATFRGPFRLIYTSVAYSGSPTQAGVTTATDSGLGSGYDATVNTGSANAKYTTYLPTNEMWFDNDDGIVLTALAGGSGQTAGMVIAVESIRP